MVIVPQMRKLEKAGDTAANTKNIAVDFQAEL
jgi:hypothetical protein